MFRYRPPTRADGHARFHSWRPHSFMLRITCLSVRVPPPPPSKGPWPFPLIEINPVLISYRPAVAWPYISTCVVV